MTISTRTGDDGTTGLLYNRRVSKLDPRIEVNGVLDELNARIGLVRAYVTTKLVKDSLPKIQAQLVKLMGTVALDKRDLERYKKTFQYLDPEDLRFLSGLSATLDELTQFDREYKGWADPGNSGRPAPAFLDLATRGARTAEREYLRHKRKLTPERIFPNLVIPYLNRLSDVLWLMARYESLPTAS